MLGEPFLCQVTVAFIVVDAASILALGPELPAAGHHEADLLADGFTLGRLGLDRDGLLGGEVGRCGELTGVQGGHFDMGPKRPSADWASCWRWTARCPAAELGRKA